MSLLREEIRTLTFGARIALAGLLIHLVSAVLVGATSGFFGREPEVAAMALGLAFGIAGVIAVGIVRRWRLVYLLGILVAVGQVLAWIPLAASGLAPFPPIGLALVALGPGLSSREPRLQ